MKKLIISLLVAAAPAVASAQQVQLLSGYNFGQFIGAGEASTDGLNGSPTFSIRSNFAGNTAPGPQDSGIYKVNNAIESSYSAGVSTLYWNGTNGSDSWTFGTGVSVVERGSLVAVNHNLVNGLQMFPGDDNNAGLRFASGNNNEFSIVTNTTGWEDFEPTSFSQPNDFNFTFSAYAASGASASIQWTLNGVSVGTSTANAGEFQAFTLDLPSNYYGTSAATLVGLVTGDIVIDHVQINAVAVPEPSTYGALAGAMALVIGVLRRRRARG